jgi:ABC-type enterochelin transport system permease subunit
MKQMHRQHAKINTVMTPSVMQMHKLYIFFCTKITLEIVFTYFQTFIVSAYKALILQFEFICFEDVRWRG